MTVHVIMMMRNEMGRYLSRSLPNARAIARVGNGRFIVTDDHSDDYTADIAKRYCDHLQYSDHPMFWHHEGQARQRHLDFVGQWVSNGDWVLSLDADETISDVDRLVQVAENAPAEHMAIGLPLYEFWEETKYRVDGQWFGTSATRLFRWRADAKIADKQMASGSEPTYVQSAVAQGRWTQQTDVHLLHWGYLNPEDRERKYLAYTGRLGGHGHGNLHVQSIIGQPVLRDYA